MLAPDQRLFETDLQSAAYRSGVAKGLWAEAEAGARPDGAAWPNAYFWMAAAPRTGAPDRYYVALNLSGYRSVPPTGPFWDPIKKQVLERGKWPKGKPGSRFAMVFRTDGFSAAGRAFYHPYDRAPVSDHPQWRTEQPHLVWTDSHTIVNYLEEFQSLLTWEIILAPDVAITEIKIPVWLWAAVIFDLRRRGGGVRESGAFLLGRDDRDPARVTAYICYDDVDPDAYQQGAIAFHAKGCAALWQHCRSKQLQLLIDVHTHPGPDVGQSAIDVRHPMLPILGHTAMIVPNYARTACWSLNAVGVYEYLGGFRWRTYSAAAPGRRVKLSLW